MRAWYAAHGGRSFANHFTNFATICLRSPLASLNQSNQCCRLVESVPPVLAPPERRLAASMTVSPFKLKWASSGGCLGYASRLMARGSRASGRFDRSTSITFFPVFEKSSPGCITPSFSLYVIQCTAVCRFPCSTRLWKVFVW